MIQFSQNAQTFISSLIPKAIRHGFGTRMSGNGRDPQEVAKYLRRQSIRFDSLVDPEQVHGNAISVISDKPDSEIAFIRGVDGLITSLPGVVLSIITADCAPLFYVDVTGSRIGISHNGRKGTELTLAEKMIKTMISEGSELKDLRVAIGPCIGFCSYPTNLVEKNVRQLRSVGVEKNNIDFFPFCTECDQKRFFSYRGSERVKDFPEQFSFIMK